MTKSRASGGGRKPLPTALKVLRGNPGKRPLNENSRSPRCDCRTRPLICRLRPAGEWRRAQARSSWDGPHDGPGRGRAGAYCVAYAHWSEAEKALRPMA